MAASPYRSCSRVSALCLLPCFGCPAPFWLPGVCVSTVCKFLLRLGLRCPLSTVTGTPCLMEHGCWLCVGGVESHTPGGVPDRTPFFDSLRFPRGSHLGVSEEGYRPWEERRVPSVKVPTPFGEERVLGTRTRRGAKGISSPGRCGEAYREISGCQCRFLRWTHCPVPFGTNSGLFWDLTDCYGRD